MVALFFGVEYEGQELVPYKQGQLDRFCGLYALINAVRLASRGIITTEQNIDKIFQTLLTMAVELQKPQRYQFVGLDEPELEQLAKTLLYGLNMNNYKLSLRNPYKALVKDGERQVSKQRLIERATKKYRTALIVHVNNEILSHWSVAKSIEGKRVELFDSDNLQSVSLKHVTPWRLVTDRTDHF